jgi:TRAP-type C4-dicarboxylate transport system permease small subunit
MTKVLDTVFGFLAGVISVILVFMTLSIGYSIFARAVNLPGPVWIVQFNEYAMLFATFLGAAWLLSKGKHVSIELVASRFGRKGRRILGIFYNLLGLGISAILCWYGTFTTLENFQRKVIHVQAVDVPMAYILFVIPLGFFFLFLQFALELAAGFNEIGKSGDKDPAGALMPDSISPVKEVKTSEGGAR